jgi:hypothetical protein
VCRNFVHHTQRPPPPGPLQFIVTEHAARRRALSAACCHASLYGLGGDRSPCVERARDRCAARREHPQEWRGLLQSICIAARRARRPPNRRVARGTSPGHMRAGWHTAADAERLSHGPRAKVEQQSARQPQKTGRCCALVGHERPHAHRVTQLLAALSDPLLSLRFRACLSCLSFRCWRYSAISSRWFS